ncbi:MAG: DUF2332 domain-containing protein [Ilumatobacteraceae bacterium]
MADTGEVQQMFRDFAATTAARAPLYARLSTAIADDPDVAGLLLAAPPSQGIPVLLFAAVHDLVLRGHAPELAAHYPNLAAHPAEGDPWPAFRALCRREDGLLRTLLASRHTQTNEIGRCALFLPAFGLVAAETAAPIAQVDVGTSAGLTLLWHRYGYRYEPGGDVGPDSSVVLPCSVRGDVPLPAALPPHAAGVGLDLQPIDVTDDDAVRWLEACCWPDQADRFHRLEAAVRMARTAPPDVRAGDAVADVAALVREAATRGHPVVTTSWALSYLSEEGRGAFVAALDGVGRDLDLSWVSLESPQQATGLPIPTDAATDHLTVLGLVTWRGGTRTAHRLGTAHPHGYWLHWGA